MVKSYPFERLTQDDLIIIPTKIGNSLVNLVLDTGASHTFIDFGILIKEGYRSYHTKGLIPVETANGIIYANRYDILSIEALGISKTNFEVTSYLFDDPNSDFCGVLGLDFFESNKFCIDLLNKTISLHL